MTSDALQNKHTAAAHKDSSAASPLELTRHQSFLDGRDDMFDLLSARRQKNQQAIKQAELGYMERAQNLLLKAEQKLARKEQDIKKLEDASGLDSMTGLLNRKGFTKLLVKEIARTNRGHNDGGLLVIFNLENLSSIREKYGDKAAEQATRLLAKTLTHEIRDMDSAARIANDEFILLFCETSMDKSLNRLQNMAMRLNRLSLIYDADEVKLNLSLGLKSFAKGDQADHVFLAASEDLHRNRQSMFV